MSSRFFKYLITTVIILFFCPSWLRGTEKRDSVVVSLITCWPGSEVYELCGHEALRVRGVMDGVAVDSVWNYGVFNFNEPNFVYRFVKGETDYMLAGYPFAWFLPEYVTTGRRVLEQDLNLSQEESARLVRMLREEARPENRTYRYNYVRDNCATRIIDRIDSVAGKDVVYPDNVNYGTFRKEMRAYHRNYPWYQFGIDLALGSGIDLPLKGREEMFVPVEMAEKASGAHFADGRPLVRESRILNQGKGDATLPATSWWLTPLAVSWGLFIICALLSARMLIKKRISRWVYCLWFGICGLAGCLIAFLVFVSEHEATDPNVLILWLNPIPLLFAISIWSRKMRVVSFAVSYYTLIAVGCLMIIWGFQRQSANPAFFPLMGISVMLAGVYAIVAPKYYNANKTVGNSFYIGGKGYGKATNGKKGVMNKKTRERRKK